MQYNLTHRGQVIATVEVDSISDLQIVRAQPDRLPPMPEGYSQMADIKAAQSRPCPWNESRGRKHSSRATSWL
jgi:hypothetical protein